MLLDEQRFYVSFLHQCCTYYLKFLYSQLVYTINITIKQSGYCLYVDVKLIHTDISGYRSEWKYKLRFLKPFKNI